MANSFPARTSLFIAAFFALAIHKDLCVLTFTSAFFTEPCSLRLSDHLTALSLVRQNAGSFESCPAIFDIKSPDELKNFILEDDRLAVIKVYANWCKTCKQFDIRYRKVAANWGEVGHSKIEETEFSNSVRFAQMEYGANEEICKLLDATKIPYILIYKRDEGKLAGFTCPPGKVQLLIDLLHEHALPPSSLSTEREMEQILTEGSVLVDEILPQIQKEAGVYHNDSSLSFEEFCLEQSKKAKR